MAGTGLNGSGLKFMEIHEKRLFEVKKEQIVRESMADTWTNLGREKFY